MLYQAAVWRMLLSSSEFVEEAIDKQLKLKVLYHSVTPPRDQSIATSKTENWPIAGRNSCRNSLNQPICWLAYMAGALSMPHIYANEAEYGSKEPLLLHTLMLESAGRYISFVCLSRQVHELCSEVHELWSWAKLFTNLIHWSKMQENNGGQSMLTAWSTDYQSHA